MISRFYFMVCLRDIDRDRQSIFFSPEAKLSYSWVKYHVPVCRVQSSVSECGGTTSDPQNYHAGIHLFKTSFYLQCNLPGQSVDPQRLSLWPVVSMLMLTHSG